MFHKIIYLFGIKKRNKSLISYYNFLKESEKWSLEQLKDYQLLKCKDLLCFANLYSQYYRKVFKDIGFVPENMESLDDLKKIPPIHKSVLLSHNEAIHTAFQFRDIRLSETSGTSGQVLKFYRDEEWDSQNRAALFRAYDWYDVKPWDKNGYFWGYNIDEKQQQKIRILDFLQNRFRLFSYQDSEIMNFVKKLKNASFLSGYSSMIYEVAKIVNRLNLNNTFKLKMIKGTSEKIYDNYHKEVQQAFGLKIVSEYGAAESGLIAYECPEGGHMHIVMENVIVEEENNEIIVTNLMSKSFPIIRYKLGDFIKLAPVDFKCSCGRNHLVVLDVLGRVGKKIVGKKSIYPSLTFYYVFKNLALEYQLDLNYQAIQDKKGIINLRIEQDVEEKEDLIRKELNKYFTTDIEFHIEYRQTLITKDGKLRDFISRID